MGQFHELLGLACILLISASMGRAGLLDRAYCSLTDLLPNSECCHPTRVDFRYEDFKTALRKRLYGQPKAAEWLARAVRDHWDNNRQPHRALVITLHGPAGIGKSLLTEILAEHAFALGSKSSFYHLFHPEIHFPFKKESVTYVKQIQSWVHSNVSKCEKSLFIFDTSDKIPVPVLDSLKPFVDYHDRVDGVDFRRSIFIFISNIGSQLLIKDLAYWKRQGKSRNDFPIEKLPDLAFCDMKSNLKDSELLTNRLISHFIPFLPLEREHVVECVNDYLREIDRHEFIGDSNFIGSVIGDIEFIPQLEKFFSSTGCLRVDDKVDEALEVRMWKRDKPGTTAKSGIKIATPRNRRNDL